MYAIRSYYVFAVAVARTCGVSKIFLVGRWEYNLDLGRRLGADHLLSADAGSSTTCCTTLSPLATFIARWQHLHRRCEISLNLVKHLILRIVRCVHGIDI